MVTAILFNLVQFMLSKAIWDYEIYNLFFENLQEVLLYTGNSYQWFYGIYNAPSWKFRFKFDAYSTSWGWNVKAVNNWTDNILGNLFTTAYTNYDTTVDNISSGMISIQAKANSSSASVWIKNFQAYNLKATIHWNNTAVRGKPRELKAIAQKATTTIFWVHIDNSRVTQDQE